MAIYLTYAAVSIFLAAYETKYKRIPGIFYPAFVIIVSVNYYEGRDLLMTLKIAGFGWLLGVLLFLAGHIGPGDAKMLSLALMVAGSWVFVVYTLIILIIVLMVLFVRRHGIKQMLLSGYFNLLFDFDTTTVKAHLPNSLLFLAGVTWTLFARGVIF